MPFFEKHFTTLFWVFCSLFVLQMWLCSGNLAPYAVTLNNPHLINDQGNYLKLEGDTNLEEQGCYYIANYDHKHYMANYRLVDGKPKEQWDWAYLSRRPLLYMIAFPFMKMFGFLGGGFVMAILLNIGMLAWFTRWVKKRWGATAAIVGLILLSSYPATMYWSGLPYPHILITACTLLLTILLYRVYETDNLKTIAWCSLAAGVSFLAYDTYIFFFPAFGLLLLLQKKWKAIPISVILMALPVGLWIWFLSDKLAPNSSGNTDIYSNIINAYLNATPEVLWANLKNLPIVFAETFSGAAYFYLAIFFAALVVVGLITKSIKLELPFWALAIAMLTVFVFNNMAPYYEGWQMRGGWISRIYQPEISLILLVVFSVVKQWEEKGKKVFTQVLLAAVAVVFILNARINVAPAFGDYSIVKHHYNFYLHGYPETMEQNLEKHGRRPLWVCP